MHVWQYLINLLNEADRMPELYLKFEWFGKISAFEYLCPKAYLKTKNPYD